MERLKEELENLDEAIFVLQDKLDLSRDARKKQDETVRFSRARETHVLAVAQKVASRLDQAIEHVEKVLRG